MWRRCSVAILISATALLCAAPKLAPAQDAQLNARARQILRARRGADATATVVKALQGERHPTLVGLAVGIYLDQNKQFNPQEAAKVAMLAGKRPDVFHKTMTQFAVNRHMPKVFAALMANPKAPRTTRPVAATMLSIYAKIYSERQPAVGGPGRRPAGAKKPGRGRRQRVRGGPLPAPPANLAGHLKTLLGSKDKTVVELALLAAGHLQVEGLGEQVTALGERLTPAVEAAKIYYLARTDQPLPQAKLKAALAARQRIDRRFTKLSPTLSTYDPRVPPACYLCQAVGHAKAAEYLPELHKLLGSRDIRLQIDAARAIEQIGNKESVAPLLARLEADCSWPVKVYIYSALGAIPAIESIEPLIARLKDAKGRMRLDVIYALASIFRKQEGRDPETWQRHWDGAKRDFKVDRPATLAYRKTKGQQDMQATSLGFFYFLLIRSDRLVYVLDTSMSMRGERIANLKRNMKDSIQSLDDTVLFNVISFGGNIDIASPARLITGGEGKVIAYLVDTLKLSPPTRSYDAIELGCLMAGIDTVMYLSDGAPISGHIEPWSGIIGAYTYLNRYRPVAIHTVEFNAGARNAVMMRQLARRNYGTSGSPDGVPEEAED